MTIVIAVLMFTFLVLIHELGHFLTAKKLGVRAYELAIGMGPKIFGKKYKDTEYTLRAIPFGAYVRFGDEEDSLFEEGDNFMNQSPMDRIKIIIMGPLVNIVAALLIMILVIFMTGVPMNKIGDVAPGMPAVEAGIQPGDRIIEIEGQKIRDWQGVVKGITEHEGGPIQIVLQTPDEKVKSIELTPVQQDGKAMVGITPAIEKNLGKSVINGAQVTARMSTMMLDVVKQLFTGKANLDEFSGPVGIVSIVNDAASTGWINILYLTSLLSLNLGILNLLPIPALDGSKILIYGFEAITGKAMNRELEMKLTVIGFAVLMAFTLFITFKDIMKLLV